MTIGHSYSNSLAFSHEFDMPALNLTISPSQIHSLVFSLHNPTPIMYNKEIAAHAQYSTQSYLYHVSYTDLCNNYTCYVISSKKICSVRGLLVYLDELRVGVVTTISSSTSCGLANGIKRESSTIFSYLLLCDFTNCKV